VGKPQSNFLVVFKAAFRASIGEAVWIEGQGLHNKIILPFVALLRRGGVQKPGEWFEFGDIRTDFANRLVIIEHESDAIAVHNLVKYWPFIRGEMSIKPSLSVVLCHFSNWGSYGTHRDLWHWTAGRMSCDTDRLVDFSGEQFDHGGQDAEERQRGIASCIDWLKGQVKT
jgi:hypothetical protein